MKKMYIFRGYNSGVHFGEIDVDDLGNPITNINSEFLVVENARLIYAWNGAQSLNELAKYGTQAPEKCRFTAPADKVLLQKSDISAIIEMSEEGIKSLSGVEIWKS